VDFNQFPDVDVDVNLKTIGVNFIHFRDRYGDSGRDLVLYMGRRYCGLRLGYLGRLAGVEDYRMVAVAIKRFAK
jgi:hypothetical protein